MKLKKTCKYREDFIWIHFTSNSRTTTFFSKIYWLSDKNNGAWLTETFCLYPLVHLNATLSVHHPMRRRLVSFLKILLTLRGFLRVSSVLMDTVRDIVVIVSAIGPFPDMTLFEIPDINPFAARVRFHISIFVFSSCHQVKTKKQIYYV